MSVFSRIQQNSSNNLKTRKCVYETRDAPIVIQIDLIAILN